MRSNSSAEAILKQSRSGSARENFQMRFMQMKIAPPYWRCSVETELE